jgi:hypothetical protein
MENLRYEVNAMRKAFGILALLILVLTVSPAHADGVVNYTVTGTYATGDPFSSTPISNPGDSFTFTFSVDPASLAPGPALGPSVFAVTSLDYTDSLGGTTVFSFTDNPAQVFFFLGGDAGGLFDLDFSAAGQDFVLQLLGPDPGFINGPIITLNTGTFDITPGTTDGFFSLLGELNPPDFNFDAVGPGGIVTAVQTVPEPSSFLLLGSGFLALGSFARKRFLAR